MLTEHEQLADHEARISRQELQPLQQPLDNIEEIRQALNNEWQPFETAPDGVQLLWCNHDGINNTMVLAERDWIESYYSLESDFKNFIWHRLPTLPPKEKK